jgi:hypothetical protein
MKHATLNSNLVTGIFAAPQSFATELVPDHVEVGWARNGKDWTPPKEKPPPAESYQVRAWMIRGGMDPDLVPAIITQVVPDGPQRKEALMRWDYAVRIPRDFPLVDVIGAAMNLTPEQIDAAWPEILTL